MLKTKRRKPHRAHFYTFDIYECPLCLEGGDVVRTRVYGKKPKDERKLYRHHDRPHDYHFL